MAESNCLFAKLYFYANKCINWVAAFIALCVHYVPPALVLLMTIMEDNLGLTGVRTFRNANGEYF
jgi:hypothetical protein